MVKMTPGSPLPTAGSPRPANLLQPGEVLAGYQVEAMVGKGGMGEVYRVRQLSMDRVVALKVLAPRMVTRDPTFADRFFAEAQAAGKLNHPNIVKVHDVGSAPLHTADGGMGHYFSMEYIEGESLQDTLEREGSLKESQIAGIMRGMAAAVGYAAQVGLVHRDIKPDNIMITRAGQVKLADLGLATASQNENSHVAERDEQGRIRVMGTPLYMSPEQARGQPLDHRSDQYSLGATLFHLFTGHPPYQDSDTRSVMKMHVTAAIPDPAQDRRDISQAWRELTIRLLAKRVEERFATPADLILAVDAAIAGVSLSQMEEAKAERVRAQAPWPWAIWLGISVLVVAVVMALAALTLRSGHKTPEEVPAPVAKEPAAKEPAAKNPVVAVPVSKPQTGISTPPVASPGVPTRVRESVTPPSVAVAQPGKSGAEVPEKKTVPPAPTTAVAADPDQQVWNTLRGVVAPKRTEFDYLEVKRLIGEAKPQFKTEAGQHAADDLEEILDRIILGESAIRVFLKTNVVSVEIPVAGGAKVKKTLARLSANEVVLIDEDGVESRMLRNKLRIDWADLVRQSLAEQETSEAPEITAACLWFWGERKAAAAMNKINDQRPLKAMRRLDGEP